MPYDDGFISDSDVSFERLEVADNGIIVSETLEVNPLNQHESLYELPLQRRLRERNPIQRMPYTIERRMYRSVLQLNNRKTGSSHKHKRSISEARIDNEDREKSKRISNDDAESDGYSVDENDDDESDIGSDETADTNEGPTNTNDNTVAHYNDDPVDDESDSSITSEPQGQKGAGKYERDIQYYKRLLKGTLPPSYINLELSKSDFKKTRSSTHKRNPSDRSIQRKGVAVRKAHSKQLSGGPPAQTPDLSWSHNILEEGTEREGEEEEGRSHALPVMRSGRGSVDNEIDPMITRKQRHVRRRSNKKTGMENLQSSHRKNVRKNTLLKRLGKSSENLADNKQTWHKKPKRRKVLYIRSNSSRAALSKKLINDAPVFEVEREYRDTRHVSCRKQAGTFRLRKSSQDEDCIDRNDIESWVNTGYWNTPSVSSSLELSKLPLSIPFEESEEWDEIYNDIRSFQCESDAPFSKSTDVSVESFHMVLLSGDYDTQVAFSRRLKFCASTTILDHIIAHCFEQSCETCSKRFKDMRVYSLIQGRISQQLMSLSQRYLPFDTSKLRRWTVLVLQCMMRNVDTLRSQTFQATKNQVGEKPLLYSLICLLTVVREVRPQVLYDAFAEELVNFDDFSDFWKKTFAILPAMHYCGITGGFEWHPVMGLFNILASAKDGSPNLRLTLQYSHSLLVNWDVSPSPLLCKLIFEHYQRREFLSGDLGTKMFGMPKFLDNPKEIIAANDGDSSFEIFLKILAVSLQLLPENKMKQRTLGYVNPVKGLGKTSFPGSVSLNLYELEGLSNRFSLLVTTFLFSPRTIRQRLSQIKSTIVIEESHIKARELSLLAWLHCAKACVKEDDGLSECTDWFDTILLSTFKECVDIQKHHNASALTRLGYERFLDKVVNVFSSLIANTALLTNSGSWYSLLSKAWSQLLDVNAPKLLPLFCVQVFNVYAISAGQLYRGCDFGTKLNDVDSSSDPSLIIELARRGCPSSSYMYEVCFVSLSKYLRDLLQTKNHKIDSIHMVLEAWSSISAYCLERERSDAILFLRNQNPWNWINQGEELIPIWHAMVGKYYTFKNMERLWIQWCLEHLANCQVLYQHIYFNELAKRDRYLFGSVNFVNSSDYANSRLEIFSRLLKHVDELMLTEFFDKVSMELQVSYDYVRVGRECLQTSNSYKHRSVESSYVVFTESAKELAASSIGFSHKSFLNTSDCDTLRDFSRKVVSKVWDRKIYLASITASLEMTLVSGSTEAWANDLSSSLVVTQTNYLENQLGVGELRSCLSQGYLPALVIVCNQGGLEEYFLMTFLEALYYTYNLTRDVTLLSKRDFEAILCSVSLYMTKIDSGMNGITLRTLNSGASILLVFLEQLSFTCSSDDDNFTEVIDKTIEFCECLFQLLSSGMQSTVVGGSEFDTTNRINEALNILKDTFGNFRSSSSSNSWINNETGRQIKAPLIEDASVTKLFTNVQKTTTSVLQYCFELSPAAASQHIDCLQYLLQSFDHSSSRDVSKWLRIIENNKVICI